MATFSETRPPTFRENVAQQGIVMPNSSKTFQTFWSDSIVFLFKRQPKNLISQSVFTANRFFGGDFQWNACTYFQEIYSWTGYSDTKWSKNLSNLMVTFLHFCFCKATLKSKFQKVFTSYRPFGGYFQWNMWIYFQKICSWTKYSDTKFIKNISNFFVALLHICFKTTT